MSDDPSDHLAAANAEEREALGFKAWPDSGVQTYRVQYQNMVGGTSFVDVQAATGNEAAEAAIRDLGGGKIIAITPAPQQRRVKAA